MPYSTLARVFNFMSIKLAVDKLCFVLFYKQIYFFFPSWTTLQVYSAMNNYTLK